MVDVELAPVRWLEAINGVAKWVDESDDGSLGGSKGKAVHFLRRSRQEVIKEHRARVPTAASIECSFPWIHERI